MQCRLVTAFPHFGQLGYNSKSACEGTHAVHGPQCLQGITMYSALCWPQITHGGSARAGARPGMGGGAGACQIWLMGLRDGVGGSIGGRNGRSGAPDAAAASGGQYAPAQPGVPPESEAMGKQCKSINCLSWLHECLLSAEHDQADRFPCA